MSSYIPKLSIRLMCYNQEKYIERAMDGIMMQQIDFSVEVVVGDDFSKDNTLSIIKSYNDTDLIKIRILQREIGDEYWKTRQEKGRLYNYLNILRNCRGKFIALLDGDDYWTDPLKLQKQINFFQKNPDYRINSHEVHTLHYKAQNSFKAGLGIFIDNYKFGGIKALKNVVSKTIKKRSEFWMLRVSHNSDERFQHYSFLDILNNKHFMATSSIVIKSEVVEQIGDWFTGTDGGHYFIVLIALSKGNGYHFKDFMGVHNLNPGSISIDPERKKRTASLRKGNRIFRLEKLLEVAPMYSKEIQGRINLENSKKE